MHVTYAFNLKRTFATRTSLIQLSNEGSPQSNHTIISTHEKPTPSSRLTLSSLTSPTKPIPHHASLNTYAPPTTPPTPPSPPLLQHSPLATRASNPRRPTRRGARKHTHLHGPRPGQIRDRDILRAQRQPANELVSSRQFPDRGATERLSPGAAEGDVGVFGGGCEYAVV